MTLTMTPPGSSSPSGRPGCEPRWATGRTLGRTTLGPVIAEVAGRMGLPLMPWQRMVADVGGELVENDAGLLVPAYREVIVTVPRQSGKTTLILGWAVQRALGWGTPQKVAYSAQSGNDARKKLIDDWCPILEPRRKRLGIRGIRRANGAESIEFENGSRISILASSEESGHGKTLDLGIKDELFADCDDRRDQAMVPAMATRPAAQVLTTSTMGTDESFPLIRAVERGRVAVNAGARDGVAYFEWSAGPEDDPDDPAVWARCMPALGHTISPPVVVHARSTLADGEFRRAFLNQQTRADERVIPAAAWAQACAAPVAPEGRLFMSVDVTPDRSAAALVAASKGPLVELVDHRPGTGWLLGRAVELDERNAPVAWVVDQSGPAASMIGDLQAAGLTVIVTQARDMVQACGQFYDDILEGRARVRRHQALDEAATAAAKRLVGDAWAWTRRNSTADISPLVAATLAAWAAQADMGGEPMVAFR